MSVQSREVINYLKARLPERGPEDDDFWPWINPEKQHIPQCSVCKEQYELYKGAAPGTKAEMDHSAACLWYDWFVGKLRAANPKLEITRKFGTGERCGKGTTKKA